MRNRFWTTVGSIADRLGVDLGACVGVRRLPCSPYGSVYGLSDDDDDDDTLSVEVSTATKRPEGERSAPARVACLLFLGSGAGSL